MHNSFGGSWTELKLKCLEKYIESYTVALKYQDFDLIYVDLFAGSGKREEQTPDDLADQLMIEDFGLSEQNIYEGSVRIALKYAHFFKSFEFVEKKRKNAKQLHNLKEEHPEIEMTVHCGDAVDVLPEIIQKYDWKRSRAILFLDPFGCQVPFEMLQYLEASNAMLDIFYLFPCGTISRLVNNDGMLISDREEKVTKVFGDDLWKTDFLETRIASQYDLFSDEETSITRKVVSNEDIVFHFINRLQKLFPYADENDLPLKNRKKSHMFSLCFFITNPADRAVSLAQKLWKGVLRSVWKNGTN